MVIDKKLVIKEYLDIIKEFDKENEGIKLFFPRLDRDVTVKFNHLIKIPFSVHPDTLNVSVPLDPNNIKEFIELPTLSDFLDDPSKINKYLLILRQWRK
ncbi:PRI1 [Hepatospora eriocheir]|uniref:PRI1 n=1 Tax=Hepatospora eriocheir TaxID=1081669 RepID=A0A1X0Q7T5_9MICR|nr:PRI1 [Hepatospora eriocheir]